MEKISYEDIKHMSRYLRQMSDIDKFWEKVGRNYTKQVCFRNIMHREILSNENDARKWYKEIKKDFRKKLLNYIIDKSKSDRDKICLCWSFYTFMIDNLLNNEIESFIIAYGLDNKDSFEIAKEENVIIHKDDLEYFHKNWGLKSKFEESEDKR